MPLYEYHCDNCNTRFEMRRAMQDSDASTTCPECRSSSVRRQISFEFAMSRGEATPRPNRIQAAAGAATLAVAVPVADSYN
jgi:putative FmdB family regulatory protein